MSVASKNLFAYLGNDDDGEEKPVVPVKTVEKAVKGPAKRTPENPAAKGPGAASRRPGAGGNEGAFRDRDAGSGRNQGRSTEESGRGGGGARGGAGARVRGGRGSGRPRERDDRHSRHGGQGGSEKQAAASWGATEGEAELKDEQAGEAIAKTEQKEAIAEDAAPEEPAEPEDKSVSYADYLAQQAEKKLGIELNLRSANEGSKADKKWADAKALEKPEEEYFAGTSGKKQRQREQKVKQTVDFDPRFVEPERTGGGERRGGARGGRGSGRGGRGDRSDRGGERGQRGNFRGGRGGREGPAPINTRDESAFPSLGGK